MAAKRGPNTQGDVLKQYQALRNQLVEERESILKRLAQIEEALGGSASEPAPAPKKRGRKPATEKEAPAKKKAKRKLSAAARKAIVDAQKKRWAEVRAAKTPASAASPAKGKAAAKLFARGSKTKGRRTIGKARPKKK